MTAIIFIIVLAILVFVHELGHFLVARWCGIRVDAFAIGFGPRLLHWTRHGIEYSIRLIPFGGYVKIFGENPDDENTNGPDAKRSFVHKNRLIQAAVLVAGVTFNFIFAWFLYIGIFASGVTASVDTFDKYADNISDKRVMVTSVSAGSPAEKAGLKAGDTIFAVEVNNTSREINHEPSAEIEQAQAITYIQDTINASEGKELTVHYDRGEERLRVGVTPIQGIVEGKYAIGIGMNEVGELKLPFFTAIWESLRYTIFNIRDIVVGLATFIGTIFMGTANFSDVTGPIGIAGVVGDAADLGFVYLLMITAYISLNLGVINLIPFPALDGGRLLFVGIESIVRRKIPMKFANITNIIGFALLMLLMVTVTYKDVLRLFK